jgi:very-short-patch-repair endonuclease
VEDVCARPGRRGVRSVSQVLADFTAPPPTRSDFERDFLYLCRDAGLPPPAVNAELAGYEVDCVWREERLSVELDSRTFHERRSAFEADRLRDAAVQLAGYRAIRVTHRRFYEEPGEVARTLRKLVS